jgi:hypothetical protein
MGAQLEDKPGDKTVAQSIVDTMPIEDRSRWVSARSDVVVASLQLDDAMSRQGALGGPGANAAADDKVTKALAALNAALAKRDALADELNAKYAPSSNDAQQSATQQDAATTDKATNPAGIQSTTAVNSTEKASRPSSPEKLNPRYDFFFTNVYQQEYQQMPKLRLAPDLLVYINGSRTIRTWLGDTIDLNDWLTQAQGSAGLDKNTNCSLHFYIPRHLETYFVGLGGRFVLRPFYEVEIYAKGRFLADAKMDVDASKALDTEGANEDGLFGKPLDVTASEFPTSRYYRMFWGYVRGTTCDWIEGDYMFVVQCATALRVLELTHLEARDTITKAAKGGQCSVWGQIGIAGNPIQVILQVLHQDVTVNTELNVASFLTIDKGRVVAQTDRAAFQKLADRTLKVWNTRMQTLWKRSTFYGLEFGSSSKVNIYDLLSKAPYAATAQKAAQAQGSAGSTIYGLKFGDFHKDRFQNKINGTGRGGDSKDTGYRLGLQDSIIKDFLPYQRIESVKMFHVDENANRLRVIDEMAQLIGYEFYQDLNGNVILKPPFYNMDTRADSVFNINDIDILSEQLEEDEASVAATQTVVVGCPSPLLQSGDTTTMPQASFVDLRLVGKYGLRFKQVNIPILTSSRQCFSYAVGMQARANINATRMRVQIPARPELMLGFPVYLQGRDCFGYIERISWSYTPGSEFNFNLDLNGIRRRIYVQKSRLEKMLQTQNKLPSLTETKQTNAATQSTTDGAQQPTQSAGSATPQTDKGLPTAADIKAKFPNYTGGDDVVKAVLNSGEVKNACAMANQTTFNLYESEDITSQDIGGVSVQGKETALNALAAAVAAARDQVPGIRVTSSYRTPTNQADAYSKANANTTGSRPTLSMHYTGLAFDVVVGGDTSESIRKGVVTNNRKMFTSIAAQFGLQWSVKGDVVHYLFVGPEGSPLGSGGASSVTPQGTVTQISATDISSEKSTAATPKRSTTANLMEMVPLPYAVIQMVTGGSKGGDIGTATARKNTAGTASTATVAEQDKAKKQQLEVSQEKSAQEIADLKKQLEDTKKKLEQAQKDLDNLNTLSTEEQSEVQAIKDLAKLS